MSISNCRWQLAPSVIYRTPQAYIENLREQIYIDIFGLNTLLVDMLRYAQLDMLRYAQLDMLRCAQLDMLRYAQLDMLRYAQLDMLAARARIEPQRAQIFQ